MKRSLHSQRGLTLVELMISLTLGLVLLVGVGTLFVYTNRSNRQNEMLASMQDQARFALSTLSRELSMAGYWGGMGRVEEVQPDFDAAAFSDTSASTALTAALDCGAAATDRWALRLKVRDSTGVRSNRVEFRNHKETAGIASKWRCVGGYRSGTDAVAIRRAVGQVSLTQASSASQITGTPYGFYLMTNGVAGALVRWPSAATAADNASDAAFTTGINPPISAPRSYSRFLPRIYYVRNYARTDGDGIPSLCRKELCSSGYSGSGETASCSGSSSALGFYTECLAEGIEDLQITWGLDTNNDGAPDSFTDTPSDRSIAVNAVTAQIALRVRSSTSDGSYTDDKTYKLGDADSYAPASDSDTTAKRYYRRVYSTTVYLRNPGAETSP
ncbi:PilW family protein [Hydrocarboniphaga effusa]|jgi:type IV pilus assembly protein PilW|uniref:Type IV pilus assembly protein PilW n=1 Tax=Hydrocarboniphaga effusa AP103 TaxID=1172194 RepID=I7ZCU7_9GAMM|nr:PilW family protein [Hydrocarboniphaga effusa]EIT69714.1 hypothetical protein WQQ_32960 [Hydrocarboniphaga effusa AP103]